MSLMGARNCGARSRCALDPAALRKAVRETGQDGRCRPEAISEAVTRETMRFVPIKSADQQAAAMVRRASAARRK